MAQHPIEPPEEPEAQPALRSGLATPWQHDGDDDHEGDTPWLMSYLDFMAVLVTLFVFLYASEKARHVPEQATAAVEAAAEATEPAADDGEEERETVSESAADDQESDDGGDADAPQETAVTEEASEPIVAEAAQAPTTESKVAAAPADPNAPQPADAAPQAKSEPAPAITVANNPILEKLAGRVAVRQDDQALSFEINDTILFAAASVELANSGKALLEELRPLLIDHRGYITVEGHTDDRPITTAQFPSNWELSAARASAVTRYLLELGVAAGRISPVGRADTQPRGSNASPEGRAQNRRVGIVLHM